MPNKSQSPRAQAPAAEPTIIAEQTRRPGAPDAPHGQGDTEKPATDHRGGDTASPRSAEPTIIAEQERKPAGKP